MENKAPLHYVGNPKGLGLTSYEKVASTSLTRFFGPHIFENNKWTKMMVIMREEQDRWVSGFIQDLKLRSSQNQSPYSNFKDFGKGDVLTWNLITNKNVWFCQLDDLSDWDFWPFCFHLDHSYIDNGWNCHNWIEHNNKKHNTNTATDYSNSVSKFKKLVNEYLTRNENDNFGFIYKILLKNRVTIDWITNSERYYKNYIGDNNVF